MEPNFLAFFDEAHAIYDEWQKTAATVEQMRRAYKRIAPTRVPRGQEHVLFGGLADLGVVGPATLMGPRGVKKQLARFGQEEALSPELSGALGSVTRGAPSRILMTPGGGTRALSGSASEVAEMGIGAPSTESTMKALSGKGKKALNLMTGLHEQFEQDAAKKFVGGKGEAMQFYSHLSPTVIAKEHNMLRAATGGGADEARRAMQGFRTGEYGEASALNSILERQFGPRAKVQYGDVGAPKITKAMRKRLSRVSPEEVGESVAALAQ